MVISSAQLFNIMEDLDSDGLKRFQWFLTQGVLNDYPPIPKSWLENGDRMDTVDKMVQSYRLDGAVTITLKILEKMNQNSLAEKLNKYI
ncbi:caspase b-like [Salvelinus fontinalis]|uniref:caspase b-like n=1 Tax=Salvelinus fontinalis TaxID=8038 RepID=UPI0024862574|nr:caspase b-like [Salvelinus fontinalis]